jgi:Fic/DOC family
MGKILAPRLQEIILSSGDKTESARISKLEQQQLIRKIAPRIYTSNLQEEPASIIKRNWFHILAGQYPDALLSHRSALEFRPTPAGHVYLTYSYNNKLQLPGLTIHFMKGPGATPGDRTFFEPLHVSQDARAFLENLQSSRKEGEESKALTQAELEEKLEAILRTRGEEGLNELRDKAKTIAAALGMEKEYKKLSILVSVLLATGDSKKLQSPMALARSLGDPFDPDRIELFQKLQQSLATAIFPELKDVNSTRKAYRNFAFYEGYFSNYIEGTEFTIEEAKEIIVSGAPLPARQDDSHDILSTYHIVSDKTEMSVVPANATELLTLLRERHAILLRARTSKNPGQFKDKNNRAGSTEFVDWQLVAGTLKKGFEWYSLLQHPFAKATYMMFLVSEVHPFLDGNGRIARVMMNAELSSRGHAKIIIPTVYREDYIGGLKKFTKQRDPDAYTRMLLKAWQFSANVFGEDQDGMEDYLQRCNAFTEPKEGVYLKKIPALRVTQDWSNPVAIEYGRDIRIYSSKANFSYKIYSANMGSVEAVAIDKAAPLIISKDNPYIRGIENPMISFKSNTTEENRIDFEML